MKEFFCYDNYKLIKSLIKDLTSKQPALNEAILNKNFNFLFKQLFNLISKGAKQAQINTKSMIDILSSLWELYFSKQLVRFFWKKNIIFDG